MPTLNRHIALILLLVFSFPLLYKSAHELQHHVAAEQEACCLASQGENICGQGAQYVYNSLVLTDHTDCPICAFQFSINDRHALYRFQRVAPAILQFYFTDTTLQVCKQAPSNKAARAPPVCFS